MKTTTRIFAFTLILCLLAGCTPKNPNGANKNGSSIKEEIGTYPIKTDKVLRYWGILNANIAKSFSTFSETPIAKELEKQTGVKVEYIHPAQSQEKEQFSILVASNDLPDIIEYNWTSAYPGGPEKAIDDGLIIPINDLLKFAPNYQKQLSSIEGLDKMARTDSGKYYDFATIRTNVEKAVYWGPMFRSDWLSELNLSMPETIDEWETVLRAFKNKKGATAPFMVQANSGNGNMMLYGAVCGAYKTNIDWYTDNKKAYFGPYDPQYKDFLATMAKWYAEGLLDKDFPMTDGKAMESKILSEKCGAFIGIIGSGMGTYLRAMKDKNPKFDLVAGVNPTLNKGEQSFIGDKGIPFYGIFAAGITSKCSDPELAARWLDFGYSEKGSLINNYGVENESYIMKDGSPAYTDLILKNPDGQSISQMTAKYNRFNGPFNSLFSENMIAQTQLPQQIKATETFKGNMPVYRAMPPITPTVEESEKISKIMNNVYNYINESRTKFIMGTMPLSQYDAYIEKLKSMGIEEAITLQQAALDRYYQR